MTQQQQEQQREEEEFAFKELVSKEADKLQIKRILDNKKDFGAQAKTMKWYQRARTFDTTVYDLQDSADPIYQNMNCNQIFFCSSLLVFYNFAYNNLESLMKLSFLSTNIATTQAQDEEIQKQSRFWKTSAPDTKSQMRYFQRVQKGLNLPSDYFFDAKENGAAAAANSDDESDDQKQQPAAAANGTHKKTPSKKRKREEVDDDDDDDDLELHQLKQKTVPSLPHAKKKRKLGERLKDAQQEHARLSAPDEQSVNASRSKKMDTALLKMQGKRDKDNLKVLKHQQKKDQQKKKKSQKDWQDRLSKLDDQAAKKQEKRTENIKTKKTRATKSKDQKQKKQKRPGFEGKRSKPINSGKNKKV